MESTILNLAYLGVVGGSWLHETVNKLAQGNEVVMKKVAAIAMLAFVVYNAFTTFVVGAAIGAFLVMNDQLKTERIAEIFAQVQKAITPNITMAVVTASYFFPAAFAIPMGFMIGSEAMGFVQAVQQKMAD